MDNAQPHVLCLRCNAEILQTDAKAEMACHRFLHSRCLIQLTREQDFNHFDTCQPCGLMFPNEFENDNNSIISNDSHQSVNVTRRDRIRNLYDSNEQFRKKTRELAKLKSGYTAAKTRAVKVMRAKKNEIRNQILVIKAQLQGLLEGKKDEFRASPEYKELLRIKRKYTAYDNSIRIQYNCTSLDITQYLNDKPGLRRFSALRRWYDSTYRLMYRPWYYRIPI